MPLMSPDTIDPLLRRLDEIARRAPHLARIARLYASILPLLREAEPSRASVCLSPDEARERIERGQYLLQDLEMELDAPAVARLLLRLTAAAEKAGENVSAEKVRTWLEGNRDDLGAFLQDVLDGRGQVLEQAAEQMGMDAGLCRELAQHALKPHLRAWDRQLAALATDMKWDSGSCFVCGSKPILAELQGNGQDRHLRCGVCGADWRVPRLSCLHCGNEDHRSLRTFIQDDDHHGPHIESCDRCMTYLKVIPAFSPTPVDLLPVEDLATLHLDAVARERGYRRA